jgi:hypothetical protein
MTGWMQVDLNFSEPRPCRNFQKELEFNNFPRDGIERSTAQDVFGWFVLSLEEPRVAVA